MHNTLERAHLTMYLKCQLEGERFLLRGFRFWHRIFSPVQTSTHFPYATFVCLYCQDVFVRNQIHKPGNPWVKN
ncbi:hypothetical protein CW304_10060 [Bacillus sp. UFRGS-B20]|nr:hypothetical protein CW304_10060 [Bacillus sp. UFRGS-B20]